MRFDWEKYEEMLSEFVDRIVDSEYDYMSLDEYKGAVDDFLKGRCEKWI